MDTSKYLHSAKNISIIKEYTNCHQTVKSPTSSWKHFSPLNSRLSKDSSYFASFNYKILNAPLIIIETSPLKRRQISTQKRRAKIVTPQVDCAWRHANLHFYFISSHYLNNPTTLFTEPWAAPHLTLQKPVLTSINTALWGNLNT